MKFSSFANRTFGAGPRAAASAEACSFCAHQASADNNMALALTMDTVNAVSIFAALISIIRSIIIAIIAIICEKLNNWPRLILMQ